MHYSTIPVTGKTSPVAKAKATHGDIEALAASYESPIATAIVEALQKQSDGVDLDALAAALAAGDVDKALSLLGLDADTFGASTAAIQHAAFAGGAAEAAHLRTITGAAFYFDQLNPRLITWLQTYSLGLIKQVNDGTRDAIRSQLIAGMRAGKNPRVQAQQIKGIIGLTDRQATAVANFRKELETFHHRRKAAAWNLNAKIDRVNGHQVFKPDADGTPKDGIDARRLRDFRYDKALVKAMETSKPLKPEVIDKMVEAYARKYRKYRAQTIARTEAMRATNMGVQDAWRQAIVNGKVREDLIRRFWKVAKDERTCPVCNAVPKMNLKGVKFAEPFATPKGPVMMGPLHPDCRCHQFIRMMEPIELGLSS